MATRPRAPRPSPTAPAKRDHPALSPRQREALAHLGTGLTNEETAERMKITGKTVDAHRATIKRKLGAKGPGDLVRHAIRLKLVRADLKLPDRELTEREGEVLALLGEGFTNEAIAEKLGISEKTVEAHRGNLRRKLGASTLADLVRYAIAKGLASPP